MAINEKATVEVQVNGQEAAKELDRLSKRAGYLKDALAKAYEAGDEKKIRKFTKQLNGVNKEMSTLKKHIDLVDYTMSNLSIVTPKELRKTIRSINKELDSGRVKRGSEEWNHYTQTLQRLNAELRKIKDEASAAKVSLSDQIAHTLDKWWAFYTIVTDVSDRIYSFASSKVQSFARMDEAMSQVTKYTGMARDEVKSLNDEFKKMDTRTAREQLNALAGDAGRLGIQSKDQVLEFVDAADKINVALGEDLGEDAVKNIGKLAMMFGEDKTKGMRAAMLATGSAVNEVAQNCSAAESFLVDFTARVAGAAHQAHIAQADILGFAASMDENMLREETSATAYQNILMKMYTKTEAFANAAGIEVQKFSELLRTDANEALLQFAEGLSKKGGLADLAPLFGDLKTEGAGVSAVLSVMAGKADEIRVRQALANKAYQEGTSILKEFDVQNSTVQAGLDKAKKRANDLAVELGERLQPIMAEGLHLTSSITKVLIVTIDFIGKYRSQIIAASVALFAYQGVMKVTSVAQTAWNKVVHISTILTNAYRMAKIALTNAIAGDRRALLLLGRQLVATNVATKAVAAGTLLFEAACKLVTFRIKAASMAMKGFLAIVRLNPFVAIVSTILAAGAAIYAFASRTTEADKAMKSFSSANMQEQQEMYKLYDAIRKTNEGTQMRRDLINEFNSKYGSYISNLLTEKSTVDELAAAYREASTAIQNKIAMQKIEEAKTNITSESMETRGEAMSEFQSILQRTLPASMVDKMRSTVIDYVNTNLAKGFSVKQIEAAVEKELHQKFGMHWTDTGEAGEAVRAYAEAAADDMKKITEVERTMGSLIVKPKAKAKPANELAEVVVTPTSGGGTGGGAVDEEAAKKAVNVKLEAEELRHQNELANLKRAYLNNDSMTRERYLRLSEDLELAHLNRQLDIAGLEPEKKAAINQKILDLQIKVREDNAKLLEEQEKKDQEQALSRREKQYQLEVEEATRRHYQLGTSEEQFRKDISDITDRYYRDLLADSRISEEEKARIIQQVQQKSLEDEKAVYDKRTEQFNKMKDSITGAAQAMGESMAEFFTDEETDFGDFMGNILSIMLDALEKQLIAQQAAAIAAVTINDISTKGLAGLATAMAKIALITAAFETAKAVLGNFYTGGYTGGGEWDEPKGVVHSNEFVANRFAVANPSVRPVLDLINQAQRNNTISTLRASDIAQVLPGAAAGQTVVVRQDNPELMRLMKENASTLLALQERLNVPLLSYVRASGDMSVEEAQKLLAKMKSNVSRTKNIS